MFKHNQYFDGQVASLAFIDDGVDATVGVMKAGEYRFSTAAAERMTLISGAWRIRLADAAEFVEYQAGGQFDVAANSYFDIQVLVDSSYLCHYIPA